MSGYRPHFAAGYCRLAAWSNLLDNINVFPVADGDTGANLRISLSPLRRFDEEEISVDQLARNATGNSGNIAAAFFRQFCRVQSFSDLAKQAAAGREEARRSVADPCDGTMLSVFDTLAISLAADNRDKELYPRLIPALAETVRHSVECVPHLKSAGVVDAGALAMFIFFEGFFRSASLKPQIQFSVVEHFAGLLSVRPSFSFAATEEHCIDAILRPASRRRSWQGSLSGRGNSLVVLADDENLKIHIHTSDPQKLRGHLETLGEVLQWTDAPMNRSDVQHEPVGQSAMPYHIITDAAGSISRDMAQRLGMTLLDSYIVSGKAARPESLCIPRDIYALMRRGGRVTTAQASTFERHQHYESACQLHGKCLYLCVGSVYTGNFAAAAAWKKEHALGRQLTVVDTGAASGRLALIAILTSRSCSLSDRAENVLAAAKRYMASCREYVFIDELKYLVAGGRVSRAGGFFGDLLHMKPIISPTMEGVRKEGVVRSSRGQLAFALQKLKEYAPDSKPPLIMLQYSDNEKWLRQTVGPRIRSQSPESEILLTPLSLTSGVHMGPGTWSMALAPGDLSPAPAKKETP